MKRQTVSHKQTGGGEPWKIGILAGKGLLLLLAGTVIGTVLLTLVFMLPVNPQNRETSYETLEEEGWYPRAAVISRSMDTHFRSYLPDVLDDSTDGIMLRTALDSSEGNPLVRAMKGHNATMGDYSYYWHGYVVLLRPLLLLFDFTELRIANCAVQLILLMILAFIIGREKGLRYVLMLLTSYMLMAPVAMPLSLQFSWVYYVAYVGAIILLKKYCYFAKKTRYVFIFMALGMATSFLDLLTYPLFTWGFPLIWWIVMDRTDQKASFWVKRVVTSGFGWIAGYAGMWIMKWAMATVILGHNVFESAVNEVFLRSGMQGGGLLLDRLSAIYTNWKHYEYKVYAIILLLWLVWWLGCLLVRGGHRESKCCSYLLIGVSGIVWCFVLSDHTSEHHFFTYRIFGVSVLAFLAIVLGSIPEAGVKIEMSFRKRLLLCGVYLVTGVVAVLPVCLTREEFTVLNGYEQFTQFPMEKDDILEAEFSPTFDKLLSFDIGLQSTGNTGYCELTLWEGDTPKYQERFPLEDFGDSNYQLKGVTWELDHKTTYRLTVEAKDTEETIYVWVTDNGAMPLTEYGVLSIDGVRVDGQLLTGITYWHMPVSGWRRLFLVMTWIGVLMTIEYVLWSQMGNKSS